MFLEIGQTQIVQGLIDYIQEGPVYIKLNENTLVNMENKTGMSHLMFLKEPFYSQIKNALDRDQIDRDVPLRKTSQDVQT